MFQKWRTTPSKRTLIKSWWQSRSLVGRVGLVAGSTEWLFPRCLAVWVWSPLLAVCRGPTASVDCPSTTHWLTQHYHVRRHKQLINKTIITINKLCGRPPQYVPAPCKFTFWPRKWCPNHVWLVCYLYANFGLPRPLCSRFRPDVCVRQTDVRRASSLNAPAMGAGHNKKIIAPWCPRIQRRWQYIKLRRKRGQ